MGSLVSPTKTILLPVTLVPTIVTTSTYMRALSPSMPLSSTNITSPRHRRAISRVSLLTPLIEWIYWSLLLGVSKKTEKPKKPKKPKKKTTKKTEPKKKPN
jgi:hypothetical protein